MSDSKKHPPPRPLPREVPIEHPSPPAALPPPPPTPPVDPLPIAAELTAAAKTFRDLFDTNNATYHRLGGQFAVPDAMREPLRGKIFGIGDTTLREELLSLIRGAGWGDLTDALRSAGIRIGLAYQKALPAGHADKSKPIGTVKSSQSVAAAPAYRTATARARELMARASAADRAIAAEVLDDNSANGEWAYGAVNQWLAAPTIGPRVFPKISLPRQAALWVNSLVMCGSTAASTARQLLKTRGIASSSLPAFATTSISGLTQLDSRSSADNMILAYQAAPLQSVLTKATALLTAEGYLVAGCLSGKKYEKGQHPFPEHYILLFAVHGNRYLFWDPDVTSTDIGDLRNKLDPSIGILVHDTIDAARPTFGTGFDFNDLTTLTGNYHDAHRVRHRYQVATLEKP